MTVRKPLTGKRSDSRSKSYRSKTFSLSLTLKSMTLQHLLRTRLRDKNKLDT